ncbi:hypothetical protein I6J18_21005 [Peribacillus psychrosaccharolyticus]|uniref:Uncharacterized protein n=1 Tax=Peribacillus psychrosaccharolyticus TaxID=1407 RepID=A0A974RZX8_PERPY|nr:hypothetical protein [Peribacillus psychrosaccharolyticus]MEC2056850.1 hypothetical protein [Peribacillus psychrosaccharolyticus]MED3746432.1 hypothetical protein [Peribacillus psychrosaccharolyticus]QQT00027.1 hypothetical protein I6J18_21005 [Peribacillus psychrosaccharolyticus]
MNTSKRIQKKIIHFSYISKLVGILSEKEYQTIMEKFLSDTEKMSDRYMNE